MAKRTGKFYRKNEAEVMRKLGLKPTLNSGSGWIEKEDGQNDYIICQLKSTDAQSVRIQQKDITVLEENARVARKIPVFAIQFLNTEDVFIMCRPEDINSVAEYLETGSCEINSPALVGLDLGAEDGDMTIVTNVVQSSGSSREQFHAEREGQYRKERKAT